ncbi:PP2C family serine/threonine-protein phosphatase, partial [Brachyspira innocens]|uniref:PP2C family serine/threonine-protein phosphatase n=1 Tax=Brachyspira innocens TaxID=13264 RepID=UPI0003784B1A
MGNNSFSCYKYLAQGKSHIKNNTPCQDYCDYFFSEDFSIIALSDGAGSCKFSQIGSKTLVDSTIELLKNNYETIIDKNEDEIKSLIISYLSKKIEQTALEQKIEEKQLSATLLFVLSYKDKAMYGHIGDGIIGCDFKNELIVLDRGENGEFKNETVFFRKNIKKDYLKLKIIPNKDILSFFCFSDGLEHVFISNKEDILAPKLQTYSSWIYKYENKTYEEEITDDLNYIASSNYAIDDDLSLIIMNINSDKNDKIREYKEYVIDIINDDFNKKLESQNNSINSLGKKLE